MESDCTSEVDKSPRTGAKRTSDGKLVCKIVHNKSHLLGRLNLVKQEPNVELNSSSDTEYTNQEDCIIDDDCVLKQEDDDCSRPAESGDDDQPLEHVQQSDSRPTSPPPSPPTTTTSPWGLGRFSSNIRFTNNLALFKATFPMKLWELVGDSKISMVTWSACGGAILLDTRVFDQKIQDLFPGEFGDNKLRNFCRQLRVYDFNEVNNKDPNWPQFVSLLTMAPYIRVHYHHFFRRGHPVDLCKIARVRDVIPRGRSKPKNPRPRPAESLLAPTGPYHIGQPPEVLQEKVDKIHHDPSQSESIKESQSVREGQSQSVMEVQSQISKEAQSPRLRRDPSQGLREVQTQQSPPKKSYPYTKANPFASVLQDIGQQAVLSSCSISGSKSCASAGELASFCGSLRLNPLSNTEAGPTTSGENIVLSSRVSTLLTAGKSTAAAAASTMPANKAQVRGTDEASSSSLDDNFAVTFSELVADVGNSEGHIVRSLKDQGHSVHNPNPQDQKGQSMSGKGQTLRTSYLQADAAHLHKPSVPVNLQVPRENPTPRPASSLVLVPCLRTHNALLPLTYGSRLSAAGVDFLRECPDFKLFLNQLNSTRPATTDRSQQCSPVPTNDCPDCDNESIDKDMPPGEDDIPSTTDTGIVSDSELSEADDITRQQDEAVDEDSHESHDTTDSDNSIRDVFLGYVEKPAVDTLAASTRRAECTDGGEEGAEDSHPSMDNHYASTSPDESASIDWSWEEDVTIKPIVIEPVKEEHRV